MELPDRNHTRRRNQRERFRNVPFIRCINFSIINQMKSKLGDLMGGAVAEVQSFRSFQGKIVDCCSNWDVKAISTNSIQHLDIYSIVIRFVLDRAKDNINFLR